MGDYFNGRMFVLQANGVGSIPSSPTKWACGQVVKAVAS